MSWSARRLDFSDLALLPETHELSRRGRTWTLQEKPCRLLEALLSRIGEAVPRADLYDALWPPGLHVDREAGLNTAMRKLRAVLAETGGAVTVETLPRVGYRLRMPAATTGTRTPTDSADHGRAEWLGDPGPARRAMAAGGGTPSTSPPFGVALTAVAALLVAVIGWTAFAAPDRPTRLAAAPTGPRQTEAMPADPELRNLYLEARGVMAAGRGLERAEELLAAVTRGAPDFAPAHAHLAEALAIAAVRGGDQAEERRARAAARRALDLDPRSATARRAAAMIALMLDWDFDSAGALLDAALDLDPADPINHLARATLDSARGSHEAALAAVRHAVDLAPESMPVRSDAGYFLLRAGRTEEAAEACEMVLRLEPGHGFARDCLVTAYGRSGRIEEARSAALGALAADGASAPAAERVRAAPDPRLAYAAWALERELTAEPVRPVRVARRYAELGDLDRALDWIERAAAARAPALVFVPGDVVFEPLRADPRLGRTLRLAGLPPTGTAPAATAGST